MVSTSAPGLQHGRVPVEPVPPPETPQPTPADRSRQPRIWNTDEEAEAAGFSALVLTVDAPTFGRRLDDIRNDFKLPPHLRMANFAGTGGKKTGNNEQVSQLSHP